MVFDRPDSAPFASTNKIPDVEDYRFTTTTVLHMKKRTTTQPSTTPGSNVQVVIRCRPQNKRERKKAEAIIVHTDEEKNEVTVQQRRDKLAKKRFTFDHVFGETSTQQDVYDTVVQPVVAEVLEGFNCTVFA